MRNLQGGSARLSLAIFMVCGLALAGCDSGGDDPIAPSDSTDASDDTTSTDNTTETDGVDGTPETDATDADADATDGAEGLDDADSTDDTTGADDDADGGAVGDDTSDDATGADDAGDGSDANDGVDIVDPGCPGDCPLEDNCEFCPLYETDTQIACQDGPTAAADCAQAILDSGEGFPVGGGGQVAYPDCYQPVCASTDGVARCEIAPIPNCAAAGSDCPANSPCFSYSFTNLEDAEKADYLSDTNVGLCFQNTQYANPDCCSGLTNTTLADSSFNDTFPAGWDVLDPTPNDPIGWYIIDESLAPPQFSGRCLSGGGCMHFGYRKGESDNCLTYFNGDITIEKDGSGNIVACTQADPPSPCSVDSDCDSANCGPQGDLDQPCPGAGSGCICRPSPSTGTLQSDSYDLTDGRPWLLRFQLWMETEPPDLAQGLNGDSLEVWVKPSAGPDTRVFNSATAVGNDTNGIYSLIQVDLSPWNGQQVVLEWRFDTSDGLNNYDLNGNGDVLEGVFVDDVVVASSCFSATCTPGAADSGCTAPESKCDTAVCVAFEPKTALSSETEVGICAINTIQGCIACTEASDCPTSGGGFEAVCDDGVCDEILVACPASPPVNDFEGDLVGFAPLGWSTDDDEFCSTFWKVTNNRSASGANSLYFGNATNVCEPEQVPSCGALDNSAFCPTYDCAGQPTVGYAQTEPMALKSTEAVVSFQLALSNEYDGGTVDQTLCEFFCTFYGTTYFESEQACVDAGGLCPDRLQLFAVVDKPTGTEEIFMWDSTKNTVIDGSTSCGFEPVNVLVPAEVLGEASVSFKFVYDSIEGSANENEGVYIDDLQVIYTCDLDTSCVVPGDCPALPCQEAQCVSGGCEYAPIENCCATNADCNDGLLCTTDVCDGETNTCTNAISNDSACCDAQNPTYSQVGFDDLEELPEGWTVETGDGAAETIAWRLSATGGVGGSAAIYFGNEAETTYGAVNQVSQGTITIPNFEVPPGGDPTVRFDLKLSTEFDALDDVGFQAYLANIQSQFFDRLAVYASTDGTNFQQVWRSDNGAPVKGTSVNELGVLDWADVAFSMQSFAGQTVSLRFEFDSATADQNSGLGVYIDNIRVSQVCPSVELPEPCLSNAWCTDGDACTTDTCVLGGCLISNNVGQEGCCFAEAAPEDTFGFNGADLEGWTVDNPNDPVRWHVSNLLAKEGPSGLRFGNVGTTDYSSCTCASPNACDGQCLASECALPSGLSSPASVATSPAFTLEAGQDFTVNFSLFAALNLEEGPLGFAEAFTVKLVIDDPNTPGSVLDIATLVCHAGECDVGFPPNACASGVNFEYPGCNDPVGDYDQWKDYSFQLSEVLCAGGSFAQTFINTVVSEGSATLHLEVSMETNNNAGNCKTGLVVDDVRFEELCDGWDNSCQAQ